MSETKRMEYHDAVSLFEQQMLIDNDGPVDVMGYTYDPAELLSIIDRTAYLACLEDYCEEHNIDLYFDNETYDYDSGEFMPWLRSAWLHRKGE